MPEFHKPTMLYDVRPHGDYTGWACSESDPYAPVDHVVYWVRMDGGLVTADLFTGPTTDDGDVWAFEVDTKIVMTADEIMEALV